MHVRLYAMGLSVPISVLKGKLHEESPFNFPLSHPEHLE